MNTKEPQACDVTENRFRTVLKFLRIGSVQINTKHASILHSTYTALTAINVYVMYVAFYVDIIIEDYDLKNFMKSFRMLNSSTVAYWVHLNLSWRLRDFERLLRLTESFTWEDQPTRDPHTGQRTFAGWIPHIQKVMTYLYICTCIFHLVQSGIRMYASHDLMYNAWYPFDIVSSPGYQFVIIMQTFATNFYVSVVLAFPVLYATLVMVACIQLQKLSTNLLSIKQELVPSGADSGSDAGEESVSRSEDGFCRIQTQLNECVRHHQAILQYMRAMEDTFNFPFCGLFLILLAELCVLSFSVFASWGDITDIAQSVYIYGLMFGYVCLFCAFGTELTLQAERVRDAAWGCDWVGTPVSFQRCLAFIIATANKEFTFTAGKFVPVCNSTMMNILQESVSLFMFLLTMKDKNEETVTE